MDILNKYKPSVSRRNLLLIAGLAWTTAGGILEGRGLSYVLSDGDHVFWRVAGGVAFGIVFYQVLFSRISRKHVFRIRSLSIPYPCAFSFFNLRSYILMAVMISGGITLRKLDLINRLWLYNFYISMGVPLLISAGRFYHAWFTGKEIS